MRIILRGQLAWASILIAGVIFGACAPSAWAQALSGINGTVTDTSGAVVPGAKVTVTNDATQVSNRTVTTSVGEYRVTDLIPGVYTVKVEAAGFAQFVLSGLHIDVGTVETANATLKLGSTTQEVQVTSPAIALETAEPSLGTTIPREMIEELPEELGNTMGGVGARGRQIDAFMFLAPGTQGGEFSHRIDGGVDFQNEVVFNGIPAVQSETQGFQSNINPPFELVDQFKVLQNVFPAQYGLAQGVAQYQFASGTNALHADGFEIMRNDYFDAKGANPPLNATTGAPMTPTDKEDNWGFSVGGPVILPKIYDGKDKTFFFVSSEWYHLNQAITGNMTVPTQAMVMGDFSGFPQPIYVPSGPLPSGCTPGAAPGQQFPGNMIPSDCLSTISKSLLSLIPAPTTSGYVNNLKSQINSAETRQTSWGFNIDENLTTSQTLHFSYWRDIYNTPAFDHPGYFNNELSALKTEPRLGTGIFLTYAKTFSPNLVMTAGAGWMGEINNELNAHLGETFAAVQASKILPTINFNGFDSPTTWGVNSGGETNSTNRKLGLSFANNWLYNHGRHTMNIGFEVRRSYQDDDECQECGGQFSFDSITTSNGDTNSGDPLNENNTGSAFASYLLGTADNASRQFAIENRLRNLYFAPYFQDDIKISPNFTVNAGVRWDVARPFTDGTKDNIVFFNPSAADTSAVNPATGQSLDGGVSLLGTCSVCVGYNRASVDWHEFSPRLGFAWQWNSKTVILGGVAVNHLDGGAFEYGNNKVAVNYGNLLTGTFNIPSSGTNVPAYGNWDVTTMPVPPPTPFTPGLADGFGIIFEFAKNTGGLPYIGNYNVGIQRELPGDILLSASYVGNRVLHIPSLLNNPDQLSPAVLNTLCPNNAANCVLGQAWTSPAAQTVLQSMGYGQAGGYYTPYANFINDYGSGVELGQALRPRPQYGSIYNDFENAGVANYNALQMQLQKRFTNGLTYLVSYTLSRTMSNTDSGFGEFNGGALNTYDQKAEYQIASNDQTHLLSISGVYELPIGAGKAVAGKNNFVDKEVLGGWQLSGILSYQSGTPFGIGANGCPLQSYNYICNRSNLVAGQAIDLNWNNYYKGKPVFNTAAFTDPGLWAVGNSPRNLVTLRNPWSDGENLALAKHLVFTEHVVAEIRMEYFNILNRMQVCGSGSTDTNVSDTSSGTFGLDDSGYPGNASACQGNIPRQGQATFKLRF
ncbi:MAG: carboxypeptidase-like regulatory domain-containing protein [Acidobacteriaceae bacterium]